MPEGVAEEKSKQISFAQMVEMEVQLDDSDDPIWQKLYRRRLFGLAISGGGIRSATFALGIMQYLAQYRLLRGLDYLSTVSGGGYIGSWLSAWIRQVNSVPLVERALIPAPEPGAPDRESPQIAWLRKYGNYLAPNLSLFSADTWLIAAIWARNTLLNFLLLLLFLGAVLLTPWWLLALYDYMPVLPAFLAPAMLAAAVATAVIGILFGWKHNDRLGLATALLAALAALALVFAAKAYEPGAPWPPMDPWMFRVGLGAGFVSAVSMLIPSPPRLGFFIRLILSTAIGGTGLVAVQWLTGMTIQALKRNQLEFLAPMLGPPLVTLLLCVLVTLQIGMAGWRLPDERREWWSRVGAWMGIFGAGGLVLCGMAVIAPPLAFAIKGRLDLAIATGSIWGLATLAGVLLGQDAKTGGNEKSKKPLTDRILPLAPIVFVIGFLGIVATAVYVALFHSLGMQNVYPIVPAARECFVNCLQNSLLEPTLSELWSSVWGSYAKTVAGLNDPQRTLTGIGVAAGGFLFLSRIFDINEFSLHRFYQNRLVRAYQGASRGDARHGDAFTNLDPKDDLPLNELRTVPDGYRGPIHLVNTAANLNLSEVGLDERRAASFVFTPYACGYTTHSAGEAYRAIEDRKFRFGTPITISGAAASPNMGFHTSGPVAFLMTLFNVRLGYWMYNTSCSFTSIPRTLDRWTGGRFRSVLEPMYTWGPHGPKLGTFYYLSELFGLANKKRKYVYLSDGGHFENLAVYELLKRRARYIICIDGEEDGGMKFEGLGGLARKARADLGVEISVDTSSIEELNVSGFSGRHCAIATIRYPSPQGATGLMLYLKLSVTGDEPVDIMHYRKMNPAFPHQSTGDQFFSESQFESYRALGYHVARTAFAPTGIEDNNPPSLQKLFRTLEHLWTGLPRHLAANCSRNTEAYMALLGQFREQPDLYFLGAHFVPHWPFPPDAMRAPGGIPAGEPAYSKAYSFCVQMLQLMENVYTDVDLEANYKHPAFIGWTMLFRRWAKSPLFQRVYAETKLTYGSLFQNFYERRIKRPAP